MGDGYEEDGGATIDDLAGMYRCVRETIAERGLLRDERDLFRDQAIPEAAQIMNRISKENYALAEVVAHLEAERDRLRALAFLVYRTLSDEPIDSLDWLTPEHRDLLTRVVSDLNPHLNPERARTAMQEVVAERDRLRAVVDAVRAVLAVIDSTTPGRLFAGIEGHDEVALLREQLDRLDGSAEVTDG